MGMRFGLRGNGTKRRRMGRGDGRFMRDEL